MGGSLPPVSGPAPPHCRLPGELQPVHHGASDAGYAISVPQPPTVGMGGLEEEAPDMVMFPKA